MKRRRAAHFLLHPQLAGSPPNEALVSALLSLGLDVDLYSNGEISDLDYPADRVCARGVDYSSRWLLRHAPRLRWRRYALTSGTAELPMAVAGILARVHGLKTITLADEIFTGSYRGNLSERWRRLCRFGMRRSQLTIVNDPSRIGLQRQYAGLRPEQPVVVYPGCFREPPAPADRQSVRQSRGLPLDALVICYSGTYNEGNGGLWLPEILRQCPQVYLWAQLLGGDSLASSLLRYVNGSDRLVVEPRRLSWRDAWASAAAADIGLVCYLQDAPQFRNMGTSSNRLCMFLSMGVPVIASRQPSFSFVEQYDCGVLIDDQQQIGAAVQQVAGRLPEMRCNARRAAREHIAAARAYEQLKSAIGAILAGNGAHP